VEIEYILTLNIVNIVEDSGTSFKHQVSLSLISPY